MPVSHIIAASLLQGMGLFFTMLPLNLLTYATLPSHLRTDATSLNNLIRNLSSSVGIAGSTVLLANSVQVNHAEMGASLHLGNIPADLAQSVAALGQAGQVPLEIADGIVNQQAAMMGYLNNFALLSIVCFAFIPLVFLTRSVRRTDDEPLEPMIDGH